MTSRTELQYLKSLDTRASSLILPFIGESNMMDACLWLRLMFIVLEAERSNFLLDRPAAKLKLLIVKMHKLFRLHLRLGLGITVSSVVEVWVKVVFKIRLWLCQLHNTLQSCLQNKIRDEKH